MAETYEIVLEDGLVVADDVSAEVEREDTGADTTNPKPWDPSDIRVNTKAYSLRQIIDEISDGSIDLAPDFQRQFVWGAAQQTRLIESILLGIPLPSFYFNADADNSVQVVDGVQRLTTVRDFADGRFALSGDLEYLKELNGLVFGMLAPALRRRFHQTQIYVHVIEATTPPDVKYDIFRRINTGGSPLAPQEIRHCLGRARSRSLLSRLATAPEFLRAARIRKPERMVDRELVLRFLAFRNLMDRDASMAQYTQVETLDLFLLSATRELDDPASVTHEQLALVEARFAVGMRNALAVFGDYAFRKWPSGGTRRNPLNKALFDCWSVVLSYVDDLSENDAAAIQEAARTAMTTDPRYEQSISVATGNTDRVFYRFRKTREIVEGAL
jgi:hypothetical protein